MAPGTPTRALPRGFGGTPWFQGSSLPRALPAHRPPVLLSGAAQQQHPCCCARLSGADQPDLPRVQAFTQVGRQGVRACVRVCGCVCVGASWTRAALPPTVCPPRHLILDGLILCPGPLESSPLVKCVGGCRAPKMLRGTQVHWDHVTQGPLGVLCGLLTFKRLL